MADLKEVLSDEEVYNEAAMEAFPVYNKSHMICLEMPSRAGDVSYLRFDFKFLKSEIYIVV